MRRTIGVVAMLLAGLPFLWGDSPLAKPTIEQLIEQLNDNRYAVRQAAEKAIEEMGPDALPALRKALAAKPNLDLARRIEKWIPLFELAALSNPKRITLDVKNRPVREVIDIISKQSGYQFVLTPDAGKENKTVDFKFERATFWEALDAVCSSAGLLANQDAGEKKIQLTFSDCYQPFVYRHGAFRLVGRDIDYSYQHYRSRSNHFALRPRNPAQRANGVQKNENTSESLQFNFIVEAEPRVSVVSFDEVKVIEAIDDQKRSLVPEPTQDDGNIAVQRMFVGLGSGNPDLQVAVALKPPAKNAKKLVRLQGTVVVHLEKEKKTQVLAEKFLEAKGKKFELGKTSVTIDAAKKGEDQDYELQLTIPGGQLNNEAFSGDFELRDAKGKAYHIQNRGADSNGRRFRLRLVFVAPDGQTGPPTKLVYVTQVTMKYLLPFEFHDLPLP